MQPRACLSTDDALLLSPSREACLCLHNHFAKCFEVTASEGMSLRCLNLRIVLSKDGVSLDQMGCITRHVKEHFGNAPPAPFEPGPLPADTKFKTELPHSLPLSPDEKKAYEDHHNGSLSHWIGALTHAVIFSRPDTACTAAHLPGCMAAPSTAACKALCQLMCCLRHHKHMPIMHLVKQPKTC